MTTRASRQATERSIDLPEGRKELLPGIPDSITYDLITPKLPWRVFHILSSVSRDWLHAIRTRQVHNARVQSHSAETLVVCTHIRSKNSGRAICLYSRRDNSCTELPPVPYPLHDLYECVCLDGKIYVLGGMMNGSDGMHEGCSNRVFVLDLVEQMQWKECASMKTLRALFECCIIDGKIYVFRGWSTGTRYESWKPVTVSEVYDPKEDLWSPINMLSRGRHGHRLETVGEKLFVFDRRITHSEGWYVTCAPLTFSKTYHRFKDGGREGNLFGSANVLFMAQGRFYLMDWSTIHAGIYVYDTEKESWTLLHTFSFPIDCDPLRGWSVKEACVLAVDDELLLRVEGRSGDVDDCGFRDFQSDGFASESEGIVWQEAQFPFHPAHFPHSSRRLIQL